MTSLTLTGCVERFTICSGHRQVSIVYCCRLKCLTVQTELHGELKVLRCERYVQEAMDALAADTLEQVSCRGACHPQADVSIYAFQKT